MASASSFTKYRSWSTVSDDPNDVGRIYTPETPAQKKLKRTFSTWAFSLIILSLSVMFLVGLMVGYFLKESHEDESSFGKRRDKIDTHMLHSVHENIMYFISNDNVRKISRDLKLLKDVRQTEYVKKELQTYGLDRVEVQEYDVVVTYPDPDRPNQLVVINSSGRVVKNVTLSKSKVTNKVAEIIEDGRGGDVTRLSPNKVEGELVYGDYGRSIDLVRKNRSMSLQGKVLMIRQGEVSIKEKIRNGITFGVRGILIQNVEEEKMSDITDCLDTSQQYPFPVQMLSRNISEQLLMYYSTHNRNISVRLVSNYIQIRQSVKNVVGSITGDLERDRFILIGASRSHLQVGTSYLLELARSFKDMQRGNGWTPWRSVKFCSWDHDGISDLGFSQYLKMQTMSTQSSAVAYIDLDLGQINNGSHWLHLAGSSMFSDLVTSVVKEVPDPNNDNLVLENTWDGLLHSMKTETRIQQFGVPVFHASVSQTNNLTQTSDDDHHHMYSLAAARVASLVTLRLLDEELLPFNITFFTSKVYNAIIRTVLLIKESSSKLLSTDSILEQASELKNAGKTFTEYIPQLLKSKDRLAVRRINDAIMKLQRILLMPNKYRSHYSILKDSKTEGLSSSIKSLLPLATVNNDYSQIQCLLKSIGQILHEAIFCLQSI
ncbi:N-acetylated-alpha-linked acidic dipeptidase [Mytilus galloprovincialis]|uniref:N-acetylated-alpha-linked acidic dipeptidase n=1 Tax=Mytilus galloprovincialis TaxID=29158 RepID=A0A8B6HCI6_MYTGA|nr:N-acetylated-alpha-linked acidic dipeptidase [Mytilus galloprovincialis]